MQVFQLRRKIIEDYDTYIRGFLTIKDELDAAMFHLYGINREDVEYIMGTFPIVERRDRARSVTDEEPEGRYLTRDAILEVYDRMASGEAVPYVEGARHPDR